MGHQKLKKKVYIWHIKWNLKLKKKECVLCSIYLLVFNTFIQNINTLHKTIAVREYKTNIC